MRTKLVALILIMAVAVGGIVAVGAVMNSDGPAGETDQQPTRGNEVVNDGVSASVDTAWNGEKLTITVTNTAGTAEQIDARGDVSGTHSIDARTGKSIELTCKQLSKQSGTVKVTAVDGNSINVVETVDYEC